MNLNVELTDLEPCRKQLRFTLPAEDVDAAFGRVTNEFRKQANLPGFRKGKAPVAKIKAQFSEQINERVRGQLLDDCYQQGLKEHDLQPVTSPEPEELTLNEGEPMTFLVNIETMPQFDLPEYKGLPANKTRVEITEDAVDKAINQLREGRAKLEDCDRPVADNDYVTVSFTGSSEGKPLTEISPTARGLTEQKGMPLNVRADEGQDNFIPGFTAQLIGLKLGDSKTIEITFPEEFPAQPKLQKVAATYEVTVDKVQEKVLPELNDEFAKAWEADSIDKLREGVRADLEANANGEAHNGVKQQVQQSLMKDLSFAVPETPQQQEMRGMVNQIVRIRRAQGENEADIEAAKDQITADANAAAVDNLRWHYVSRRIAEAEEIKVTSEEMMRVAVMQAQQSGADPQAAIKELQENQQQQQFLHGRILNEKVLEHLAEHATITEVDPPEQAED